MWQSSARFKQLKVKQPVRGPGHSNVTELAMKVGPWCAQMFISAIIAWPIKGEGVGGFPLPGTEYTGGPCLNWLEALDRTIECSHVTLHYPLYEDKTELKYI